MDKKSVLITGSSTGLGLATAVYLAERGIDVYASMRNLDDQAALCEAAAERHVQLNVLQLDITDKDSIETAVDAIIGRSGKLFGLVNNAGTGLRGYFEDLEEDEIQHLVNVNLLGTMAVTRAVLPHMRSAKEGRIVIITSVGGRIASLGLSSYCATKFAQEGFGEALYQEVAPFGIKVSLVEPAIIKTERWGINRGLARGAQNPESPYYKLFQASEAASDRLVESSPTKPVDVARCVHTVMTVKDPKLRYSVGRRAKFALMLRHYLPDSLFDRLYFGVAINHVVKAADS
jgi:NAD(P)-dependent dehydrogenase (short-subunit alcohol dehydrogenase family)